MDADEFYWPVDEYLETFELSGGFGPGDECGPWVEIRGTEGTVLKLPLRLVARVAHCGQQAFIDAVTDEKAPLRVDSPWQLTVYPGAES